MDLISPTLDSDNESDPDALVLDTDYDFPITGDCPSTGNQNNIGSVWRDIVVGEQMEGCLTRLEVSSRAPGYTDIDDPNYIPINNGQKRKRVFSSNKSKQKVEYMSENEECDLESNHVMKKRYSHSKDNSTKCNYKYVNTKRFVEKRENNDNKTKIRMLPSINEPEKKTTDEFLKELCTNLHEHNKILMLSVISKIDRKIILEKYNKTCLIEMNGGQMVKNGDRRRTSGGIFFNLIKGDKSIPNSAKKDLYSSSQNEDTKKKKRQEKIKRKKEKLKKMIAQDKQADHLKKINEKLEIQSSDSVLEIKELTESICNDN